MNTKVYDYVNQRLIDIINSGKKLHWTNGVNPLVQAMAFSPYNHKSGDAYQGTNVIMTSFYPHYDKDKDELTYELITNGELAWLTFKQITELSGTLKKGSKSMPVVNYQMIYKYKGRKISYDYFTQLFQSNPSDKDLEKYSFIKYYNVFNQRDIQGIEFKTLSTDMPKLNKGRISSFDTLVDTLHQKPKIIEELRNYGGYSPHQDLIKMPVFDSYELSERYYSTLFHELGHSTGHANRLDRKLSLNKTTKGYAKEELIAELTASYFAKELGFLHITEEKSAKYIRDWHRRIEDMIKEDSKAFLSASSEARKAYEYLTQGVDVPKYSLREMGQQKKDSEPLLPFSDSKLSCKS